MYPKGYGLLRRNEIVMSKAALWVMEKKTGTIHEIGLDADDKICLTDGKILYKNRCDFGTFWSDTTLKGRYSILPSLFGKIIQPVVCILDSGHCAHPITDCANCPIRAEITSGSTCEFK